MKYLRRSFSLGRLVLPSNIFCAPLAGCSDVPFRKMLKRYHPGLMFCEMVKMDALIRKDIHTFSYLDYESDMHPIGAQLCGSKPEIAGACAKIIEDLGFDVIDLNCGCPVDKVTKDGSGSGLLKNPQIIGEIVSNMVAAVKVPVTIKIRIGWEEDENIAPEIVRVAEQAGAKLITIHGRTRMQSYRGFANRDAIREAKAAAKEILVFGNGDIFDAASAQHMFEHTNCDGILVARGTMGHPWIIEDIYNHLSGHPAVERDFALLKQTFYEHFEEVRRYHPEKKAILEMRRIGCWYLKNVYGAKELRDKMHRVTTLDEIAALIQSLQEPEERIYESAPLEMSCTACD